MTVRPLTILALAAGLAGAGAGAGPALGAAAPATSQRYSATLDACHPAADLAGRYATFAAQMTAVPGTDQMSIHFELDERTPAAPGFHVVSGVPGFGVWKNSAPGVDIFGFSQEVTSLSSPAAFRVTIGYRWIGARHRVIKRAKRVTPVCSLPVVSANLVVGSLSRLPSANAGGGLCTIAAGPATSRVTTGACR